jgi:hypothetical protein
VSKVGLRMLPLSRSDPLLPEFPPFMLDVLEVVNSLAESPKCVSTWNEQEPKARIRNCRNQTLQFCWDRWLSGAPSSYDEVLLLWPSGILTVEMRETWQLWRLKWWLIDLLDEKEKETRKLGQKYKNKRFDWMCWSWITIGHDLYLYRQQDVALWVGYDQIFPK